MHIVKGMQASLLHKAFSHQGRQYFAAGLLWGFRLSDGQTLLEQDLWTALGNMMGKSELFDAGMPKAQGEYLVYGSFIAPGGESVQAGKVKISIGGRSKELAVFGDRYWVRGLGTAVGVRDPEPFTEMPVVYGRAFGGDGYELNPVGKGMVEIDVDGEKQLPLPNIEYPERLIGSPGDRPPPAGLGRMDIMWKQRLSKAGTYDRKYIEERMPGLPDDIEWSYFNDAAEDQWLEGFFGGEESFEIINMNAERPMLRGRLPGVKGRCFVDHFVEGGIRFREIPLRLDTVWFFPNDDLGVLIHRGTLEVAEDDASDIRKIIIAHEGLHDEPRSDEHYADQLSKRTDPAEAYKYLMNTVPLIPVGSRCGFEMLNEQGGLPLEMLNKKNIETFTETKKAEVNALVEEQKAEAARQLEGVDMGMDVTQFLDYTDPSKLPVQVSEEEQQLKALVEKMMPGALDNPEKLDISRIDLKVADEIKAFAEELAERKKSEAMAMAQEQLQAALEAGEEVPGLKESVDALQASLAGQQEPPMLPRINLEELMQTVREQAAEAEQQQLMLYRSMGVDDEQLAQMQLQYYDAEQMETLAREAQVAAMEAYRQGAHYVGEARSPHPGQEATLREQMLERVGGGQSCASGDYAFCDFSGQQIRGADLSGALLEHTDFTNATLVDVKMDKAVLAGAKLHGTHFRNVDLREANLGACDIQGARFEDCDMSGGTLSRARIVESSFHRCTLVERMDLFLDTRMERVDFSGSDLHKANLIDADMTACRFDGADLSESNLINPRLAGAGFDRARLEGVNFINAEVPQASFREAQMHNVRFVGECNLQGGDFEKADAGASNFRGCNLEGANFNAADVSRSDFAGANLRHSKFYRTNAVLAQFNKADMGEAELYQANLMEASLHKARLTQARFTEASLYSVNFLGATVGATDFTAAFLAKTVLKDWRPE